MRVLVRLCFLSIPVWNPNLRISIFLRSSEAGERCLPLKAFTWGNRSQAAYHAFENFGDCDSVKQIREDACRCCVSCVLLAYHKVPADSQARVFESGNVQLVLASSSFSMK